MATSVCFHLQAADMPEGSRKSKILFKTGTVLNVVAYDGAHSIFPIAAAHLPGHEDQQGWEYVLTHLKLWLGDTALFRDPNLAFMADLGPGFLAAARNVMPVFSVLSCGEHREVRWGTVV